jgi:hypothetical protein
VYSSRHSSIDAVAAVTSKLWKGWSISATRSQTRTRKVHIKGYEEADQEVKKGYTGTIYIFRMRGASDALLRQEKSVLASSWCR